MSKFYVTRNLSHDGKDFVRGDSIELVDIAAPALIEMGVVQTDPITDPAPVQEQAPEQETAESADLAKVGGEENKTGEPSMDGEQGTSEDKAKDITPLVDEGTAPVQEQAPRSRRGRASAQPPAQPDNDVSANL